MLSWSCQRFRARFVPGTASVSAHPHRRACRECDAFAAALETAAGARLPPAGLRKELKEIAAPGEGSVLAFPVPRLPMPDALADRLSALGGTSRLAPLSGCSIRATRSPRALCWRCSWARSSPPPPIAAMMPWARSTRK